MSASPRLSIYPAVIIGERGVRYLTTRCLRQLPTRDEINALSENEFYELFLDKRPRRVAFKDPPAKSAAMRCTSVSLAELHYVCPNCRKDHTAFNDLCIEERMNLQITAPCAAHGYFNGHFYLSVTDKTEVQTITVTEYVGGEHVDEHAETAQRK